MAGPRPPLPRNPVLWGHSQHVAREAWLQSELVIKAVPERLPAPGPAVFLALRNATRLPSRSARRLGTRRAEPEPAAVAMARGRPGHPRRASRHSRLAGSPGGSGGPWAAGDLSAFPVLGRCHGAFPCSAEQTVPVLCLSHACPGAAPWERGPCRGARQPCLLLAPPGRRPHRLRETGTYLLVDLTHGEVLVVAGARHPDVLEPAAGPRRPGIHTELLAAQVFGDLPRETGNQAGQKHPSPRRPLLGSEERAAQQLVIGEALGPPGPPAQAPPQPSARGGFSSLTQRITGPALKGPPKLPPVRESPAAGSQSRALWGGGRGRAAAARSPGRCGGGRGPPGGVRLHLAPRVRKHVVFGEPESFLWRRGQQSRCLSHAPGLPALPGRLQRLLCGQRPDHIPAQGGTPRGAAAAGEGGRPTCSVPVEARGSHVRETLQRSPARPREHGGEGAEAPPCWGPGV